ncbi:MAG TPA: tetratricopeptide repeat protein, partial [Anaeromyxobacteraceae bacterium]|nr:tetratricopeptide repeat protein [Anaeromyxobacteraceae bacterium]
LEVAGNDPTGYLALSRAAREATKGHARAEGRHFVVSHPPGKDEVLVPYLLDALERQREALSRSLGWVHTGKLRIEIVNDVRELALLTTLTEAEIRTSGTVAVCKFDKIMMLSPKALLKGYDWLDTAAHEYTHHVVTRLTRNRAPIWLHEGIAKWSETRWRGTGGESFSPLAAALIRSAVAKGNLVTFEEMHPSMARLPSQERAALAFAEVVLAVELLVKQGGPRAIARVLEQVAAGTSAEQAVARTLGTSFERFEADWRRHLAARPLPRGGEHELRKLRFRDDPRQGGEWAEWSEIPDPRARGFARLGEIMRVRGRLAAARVEYGKALAMAGARVPILSVQFAVTAAGSGRQEEAERALGEALDWNPDYAALNVQVARLLLARGEHARARDHLQRANRQDPFDPEIHAGLALALEALGDSAGAERERGFARILAGPGHP